jgi:hypothetical protein
LRHFICLFQQFDQSFSLSIFVRFQPHFQLETQGNQQRKSLITSAAHWVFDSIPHCKKIQEKKKKKINQCEKRKRKKKKKTNSPRKEGLLERELTCLSGFERIIWVLGKRERVRVCEEEKKKNKRSGAIFAFESCFLRRS